MPSREQSSWGSGCPRLDRPKTQTHRRPSDLPPPKDHCCVDSGQYQGGRRLDCFLERLGSIGSDADEPRWACLDRWWAYFWQRCLCPSGQQASSDVLSTAWRRWWSCSVDDGNWRVNWCCSESGWVDCPWPDPFLCRITALMGSVVAGAGVNPADQRWGFWPLLPRGFQLQVQV